MRELTEQDVAIISGADGIVSGETVGSLVGAAVGNRLAGNSGAVLGGIAGGAVGNFFEGLSDVQPTPGIPIVGIPPVGSMRPIGG